VEAVWWVKDEGIMTQWRVRGDAWVIGPDADESKESANWAREALEQRMRCSDESKREEWKYGREVTAVFGAQSPAMKGSFRSPAPGQPAKDLPNGYEVGMKIDDVNDSTARENFRVVVIRPFEVESTDLSDPKTARRQRYTYHNEAGWSHQELWP